MLRTAKEIVYSKQPTTPTPNSYTIQKVRRKKEQIKRKEQEGAQEQRGEKRKELALLFF